MRMYLGDLSHDTVGLATEVFPLNIGYIAAYAKQQLGDSIEVRLFKYSPKLEDAIAKDPPDVLAMSNYPWCHNISMAMFEHLSACRPEAIRVMGGPNFPHAMDAQQRWLESRPLIDAYTYLDGEVPVANLLKLLCEVGDLSRARDALRSRAVPGCAQLGHDGQLIEQPTPFRIKDLEEIPSPYLMGLMDTFFDGRLSPMIQTNRGCPFQCTFCADGSKLVSRVHQFPVQRVRDEVMYIGERVPKNVKSMHIADLNFGMYKRDAEVCEAIAEATKTFNFPLFIDTATGKNSKHRIIHAIEKLQGTLGMIMSVQSMTPEVLTNIKRDNIKLDQLIELKPAIKKANLPTSSEIILGLPGETKRSHLDSLGQLMEMEMDHVTPYTLMLLNGSEMATPEQRERWGFETKYRIIPRDFTKMNSGKNVIEVEEVVVATNTLPFEDYAECRMMALLLSILSCKGFRATLKLMLQNGIPLIPLFERILATLRTTENETASVRVLREFERETRDELWETQEELERFFEDDANFSGLIDGTHGKNLIQTYRARAVAYCFDEFADHLYDHVYPLFSEHGASAGLLAQLAQTEAFSRGRTHNLLGKDRLETVPETDLAYDFDAWIDDPDERPLSGFAWGNARRTRFGLSGEQYQVVEDSLNLFGHNDLGLGKVLIRINPNVLWRKTMVEGEFDEAEIRAAGKTPAFYTVPTSSMRYP